ncbi:hypothetical protein [Streptomyces sp. NPDC056227]|uniref:hypothetical protein n=1 Tax=Streptomyces sp. NPDC056227 TaxID=3345753 RepID=UPI0035DDC3F7
MSSTAPAQCVVASGWATQRWEPQWHQAWGRTVAALAWAKARSAARSLERGGIRQAGVLQETLAERSLWPVIRTV